MPGLQKRQKKKKWITGNTWKHTEERRKLKKITDAKSERLLERYKAQYRTADRAVKKMAKADKRAYVDELTRQAEEAAERGEQGKVFRISKLVCGKCLGNQDGPIKDKQGKLLKTDQ